MIKDWEAADILGIDYWDYREQVIEKLVELRSAYNKAERDYWEAKDAFYDFSDGFQYYYCFKYKIGKIEPGALDYMLVPGCPFYPTPKNAECLWHAEFCNTELLPFVVFTNNPGFHFDTTTEDHMVVHCNTEKLKEFSKTMDYEELDPESESTHIGINIQYHLIDSPKVSYILREEHDRITDRILNSKTISIH